MEDNNKITIDISVNSNGQEQINQYIQAFDSLRNSIDNLSRPLNTFSNNIKTLGKDLSNYTDDLAKLNHQNQELGSSSNKVAEVSSAFQSLIATFKLLSIEVKGWYIALTGGLAVLTVFAPEIIKIATAYFKGKDAIDQAMESLKAWNGMMKEANKNAAEEISRLQVLYKAAIDKKNADDERLKSVKELKKEFPEYLGNLKDENILNGNIKTQYDQLAKSIVDTAKAKAALNKITEQENKILDADFQIEKIKNANYNEVARRKRELAEHPVGRYASDSVSILNAYKAESDERAKTAIDEQTKIKESAQQTVDFLERVVGGANKIANTLNGDNNIKKNKQFYESQLAEQEALLDKLDANDKKKFEENAKAIKKRIIEINETLAAYATTPASRKKSIHVQTSVIQQSSTTTETASNDATKQFQQITEAFNKKLELEHNNYAIEQQQLQFQLDKKLISQEEYQQQSEALEDKYHVGIGEKIKRFNEQDLANAQKHQQDMVAAKQQQELMDKDEHEVKKAIMPAEKLAADKQLIADKYNFEIQKAAEAGKDTLAIREQYQQEITALTKRYEEERKAFELQTAEKVSNTAFGMLKSSIQSQSDAKIKNLETQKQAELSNSSLTAAQKQAINDKYKKKEADEKVKAFKAEQKASILQAIINGALAITKATAQSGMLAPFVIPGIILETAIQVATIAKQKAPQYAKGGLHYQSDGRGALLSGYSRTDDTNAYLRSGEAIVVSEAMRNPWARNLVSAINVAHGGRDFSISNPGRGYAIGGIFTDGGNANRYYSQPANDVKDLANTLAYQMINNFPPIYVDVKDVNNQQNILAQTVNRVNL